MPPDPMTDPTPATPDEAMAALAEARHAMVHVHQPPGWCESAVTRAMCEGYARQEHGHLAAAGWTLSRQQATPGEAVARLRRIVDREGPDFTLSIHAGELLALRESLSRQQGDTVAARVEDVARRLHQWTRIGDVPDIPEWDLLPQQAKDEYLGPARYLLGVGDRDGGGDW